MHTIFGLSNPRRKEDPEDSILTNRNVGGGGGGSRNGDRVAFIVLLGKGKTRISDEDISNPQYAYALPLPSRKKSRLILLVGEGVTKVDQINNTCSPLMAYI